MLLKHYATFSDLSVLSAGSVVLVPLIDLRHDVLTQLGTGIITLQPGTIHLISDPHHE